MAQKVAHLATEENFVAACGRRTEELYSFPDILTRLNWCKRCTPYIDALEPPLEAGDQSA